MSIYDNKKVTLPQVKVSEWQKGPLYGFLKIFNRKYADFIRDICDVIVKWSLEDFRPTFNEHLDVATRYITQDYIKRDYIFYKARCEKERTSIFEQIGLQNFPTKKIERLPQVTVSKWQAENLYKFLATFGKNYANFIRRICDNVRLNTLEASVDMVEFSKSTENIFKNTFDKMIEMDKMRGVTDKQGTWPTDYRGQRSAVAKKSSKL